MTDIPTTNISTGGGVAEDGYAGGGPPQGGRARGRPGEGRRGEARAPRKYVARAELVLARDDMLPLREVPLRPDPLTDFARAFAALRSDLGESASVVVDLLPVSPAQRAARRGRLLAEAAEEARAAVRAEQERTDAHRSGRGAGGRGGGASWGGRLLDQVLTGLGHGGAASRRARGPAGPGPRVPQLRRSSALEDHAERRELRAVADRLANPEVLFGVQILIRVESEIRGRPHAHLQTLIACWEKWAGVNYLKVHGTHAGWVFLGADVGAGPLGARARFDRRFDTGRFDPPRESFLSATDLAGWLKPPTVHCQAPNVVRSGGVIPPPPQDLPAWTPERRDLLPLGRVAGVDGDRFVGVPLADTLFSYMSGRSGFGKTEAGINQFLHLALTGQGCMFLDPHEDAIARLKPYLVDVADRVVEINLASEERQGGWNLLSMTDAAGRRRPPRAAEGRVAAVVDSFASALGWTDTNNRAKTLLTMASQTLVELALVLPGELAPTLFQVKTILADDDWREAVLPFASARSRSFWRTRFAKLSPEAITPVTNLIDRLESSSAVRGLLGAPGGGYDVRRCMDEGLIVLACPAGVGDKDRLIANFFVYDVLQAALSRKDTPPQDRRAFHVFLDEVQSYSGGGHIPAMLEQLRKYKVKGFLFNQNPERLDPDTLTAIATNRSHLATSALDARGAALVAREYGGAVAARTIGSLQRYTYLTSVTLGGRQSAPFLVRGVPVEQTWAHRHRPEGLGALEAAIDVNSGRRPVRDTADELDTLDERIVDHLEHGPGPDHDPGWDLDGGPADGEADGQADGRGDGRRGDASGGFPAGGASGGASRGGGVGSGGPGGHIRRASRRSDSAPPGRVSSAGAVEEHVYTPETTAPGAPAPATTAAATTTPAMPTGTEEQR